MRSSITQKSDKPSLFGQDKAMAVRQTLLSRQVELMKKHRHERNKSLQEKALLKELGKFKDSIDVSKFKNGNRLTQVKVESQDELCLMAV